MTFFSHDKVHFHTLACRRFVADILIYSDVSMRIHCACAREELKAINSRTAQHQTKKFELLKMKRSVAISFILFLAVHLTPSATGNLIECYDCAILSLF